MSEIKEKQETGRTPSMFASILVVGFMISLIMALVIFFADEVADGPLSDSY
jgi:hypothetical protein